jgi:ceramide glucosyltransferase
MMDLLATVALKIAVFAMVVHLTTVLIALRRLRIPDEDASAFAAGPAVTIVRPVRGADPGEEHALRTTFTLSYPSYEVIFCCADAEDPVVPMLRRLIAAHPSVAARLLIGEEAISDNPKLNNVMKGWRAAAHDWIVITDSNVELPRDYLQRLLAAWRPQTGLVSAPPIGSAPQNLGAEFECALLNTYQARWQYVSDTVGNGFAQGKNLFWRKSDVAAAGGLEVLAREPAEDAAATKVVRELGLKVRLADGAFAQPLGSRTFAQVWLRQVRWARLRRQTFPLLFAMEIFSGLAIPMLALVMAMTAFDFGIDPWLVAAGYALAWFGAEAALAAGVGWHLSWRSPALWLVRECALPVLWVQAWLGKSLVWRGNEMTARRSIPTGAGLAVATTIAGANAVSEV